MEIGDNKKDNDSPIISKYNSLDIISDTYTYFSTSLKAYSA